MAAGIGATLEARPSGISATRFWFGEDQARYVVTVRGGRRRARRWRRQRRAGVPAMLSGIRAATDLPIAGERPMLVTDLRGVSRAGFPTYMAGAA